MEHKKEIKNFLYSQYLSDGLRITFGVLLPSLIFAQLGQLETGIVISLGAITTSIPDNAGPVIHKRNAMLACIGFMIFVALVTGLVNQHPVLTALTIFTLCFFFSMFNLYGNRASSVSTAVLIIMILSIDREFTMSSLLTYIALLAAGGCWYMSLSLAVSQLRPYRMAQHTLGECIIQVGQYLRLKANFYNLEQEPGENYKRIIDQQILVHQQQDIVREILFKNKMITKNQTNTGRLLVLIFSNINDLFEYSMAAHQDYKTLRQLYGPTGVLFDFFEIIDKLGIELENLGIDVNANQRPRQLQDFKAPLEQLKSRIDQLDNNLILKKVLVNIRSIVAQIQAIYGYFKTERLESVAMSTEKDLGRFVSHNGLDLKLFFENLTLSSAIFRHSARVSIVCVIGYMISQLVTGAHSYWILLTILVILKPAFSLTKQRNYERLVGTFVGGLAGAVILHYVKDENGRFLFLLIFMIGTYSFQRINYVVSVLFMTPFILIMFSFIGLNSLSLVGERIIDTFIGSFIALIASNFIFPAWEYPQLKNYMHRLIVANYTYLYDVAIGLTGKGFNITEYKLKRKELYLSSANMASALQRMLSEPKSKQRNVREVNKFIVLNHVLSSYIVSLVASLRRGENIGADAAQVKILRRSLYKLKEAIVLTGDMPKSLTELKIVGVDEILDNRAGQESTLINQQLQLIEKVSGDILSLCEKMEGRIVEKAPMESEKS